MSDDRPDDPSGSDGRHPDQGGTSPYQGPGDPPSYSLDKGGDDAPAPTYGYGPPSYGSGSGTEPAPSTGAGQPDQGAPPTYGGQPSYDPPSYDPPSYDQPSYGPPGQGDQYGGAPQPGYGDQGSYPPPGTAAGYGAYAAGGAFGGTPPPPKKKRRTGLIIGLLAGGLVIVLGVAIGLVALLSGGGGGKPSETVKAYLQALADGDAAKALDQGEKPADTSFTTSAALKAQQDLAKISAIDVSNGTTFGNSARVTATYKFGDKQAGDESFSLTKIGGDWKLDDTTYPIDPTSLDDIPGLTLLGVDAAGKDKAYVFPGPLVWGSSNQYLTVKEQNADDFTVSPSDGSFSFSTLETGLSDAGEKAVADAVTTFIANCAKSKDLEPDGCPNDEYDYDGVDGTAVWTAPDDLSSLQYQTGSPVTEVDVSGDLTWSVTYTSEDYDGTKKNVTDDAVDGSLYGTVDLSKSPPVYSE